MSSEVLTNLYLPASLPVCALLASRGTAPSIETQLLNQDLYPIWHPVYWWIRLDTYNQTNKNNNLHVETMCVCSFSWCCSYLLLSLLSDLTHQAHLVERKFILSSSALHDCSQEGLWVEEPREPNRGRKIEI